MSKQDRFGMYLNYKLNAIMIDKVSAQSINR